MSDASSPLNTDPSALLNPEPSGHPVNKGSLTERELCNQVIVPAVKAAGWTDLQIREEVYFTKGRVYVRGKFAKRGDSKRADFILDYKPNLPIAVIEAKDNRHSVGDGIQQALGYANTLDIPFVFSSNGDGFVFHDRTGINADRVGQRTPQGALGGGNWSKF